MEDASKLTNGQMRLKLGALGLLEDGMTRQNMEEMLAAVENSRISAIEESQKEVIVDSSESQSTEEMKEDVLVNIKIDDRTASAPAPPSQLVRVGTSKSNCTLERQYLDVSDRRMPWTLFPKANRLTLNQRISVLTAYREQQRFACYRRAKSSLNFMEWDKPLNIPIVKRKNPKNIVKKVNERDSRELFIEENKITCSDDETNEIFKPKVTIESDGFAEKTLNKENEKRNISSLIDLDSPEQYSEAHFNF